MFKSIQFWAAVIGIGAILGLSWGVKSLYDSNVKLQTDLAQKKVELSNAQENNKTLQNSAAFTNFVTGQYLNTIEVIQRENSTLKRSIANKQLYASATCTSTVTGTGDTVSSQGLCRFTPDAEEALLQLDEGIPANAARYKVAMDTLNYWHDNWSSLCGK